MIITLYLSILYDYQIFQAGEILLFCCIFIIVKRKADVDHDLEIEYLLFMHCHCVTFDSIKWMYFP